MKYLKSFYKSFKCLDGNVKFMITLSLILALLSAGGHTYVFIKKNQVSQTK